MTDNRGGKREGSGRKKMPGITYIQITLPETMRDHVKAQKGGTSAYIRRLIEKDINRKVDPISTK